MTSSLHIQIYLILTYTQLLSDTVLSVYSFPALIPQPASCSWSHFFPLHLRPCFINYSLTPMFCLIAHQKKSSTKLKLFRSTLSLSATSSYLPFIGKLLFSLCSTSLAMSSISNTHLALKKVKNNLIFKFNCLYSVFI